VCAAQRASLAPLVRELARESVGPVHALLARLERLDTGGGQAGQLQLTTVALQDAHGRIQRLETQLAELRGELGAARAARDLANVHVSRMLEDLHRAIAAAGQDTQSLARAAGQLAGTEKFLKAQNDAVRLQAAAEADALRTQNRQFRERIDHLVLDNDQYRRALGNRANGKPASGG
jgi:predicted  nucleic acid-binding Zn-ribbon protein